MQTNVPTESTTPYTSDQYGHPFNPANKKKRNRNRRRNSRSQNRQRSDSFYSNSGQNDGYQRGYRARAESNVSVGALSAISVNTSGSRPRRNSNYGSDEYGRRDRQRDRQHMDQQSGHQSEQQSGQQRQRTYRWDRDRLSREIWEYYLSHCQTTDLLTRKTRLRDALHKILTSNFTNYDVKLYIVGSSATGLATNSSDVDICIVMKQIDQKSDSGDELAKTETLLDLDSKENVEVENKENTQLAVVKVEDQPEQSTDKSIVSCTESGSTIPSANGKSDPSIPMLEKIEEVLKKYNFVTKMQIIPAKVPILKFNDRISDIEVTLNVNKLVSVRNTHLIHDYTKLDWRVQPLLLVIKAWAKDHNIKDAYNKSISSYSLVLMVIHYLQSACQPPVLPCLQQIDPKSYDPSINVNSIRMDSRPVKQWKSRNMATLKELLIGFLDYYSYTFCYSKDAISVRLGGVIPKSLAQRHKSDDNSFAHWKYLSIEEPFNRTNTARSVYDEVMFEQILSVFRVSHYTLRRYPFLDSIMTGKQFTNDYTLIAKTKPVPAATAPAVPLLLEHIDPYESAAIKRNESQGSSSNAETTSDPKEQKEPEAIEPKEQIEESEQIEAKTEN